jgi:hypothetical protein
MIVPVIGKPVELVPPGTPAGERQLVHLPCRQATAQILGSQLQSGDNREVIGGAGGEGAVVDAGVEARPVEPGKMQVTVRLKEVSCGTEVTITQENVPAVIPVEGCYMGWQDSLEQLASLVQPEIPDGPA